MFQAMSKFLKTPNYKQEQGPPIPSFDEYAKRIKQEFQALIDSDPDEPAVQRFLEANPSMVPGAWTPGTRSGHWPIHLALITQPPLHGFDGRKPDFLWLSKHSGAWYPALVEIERPRKKIFTAKGVPTAEFNQARNQFIQWRAWFDEPAHTETFMDHYGVPLHLRTQCVRGNHFILIYGRRSEVNGKPALSKQRGLLMTTGDEEILSYDRLSPDSHLQYALTVKATGGGQFEVIAVPETFAVCSRNASILTNFTGIDAAIDRNERISRERAAFLKRRVAYWTDWIQSEDTSGVGGRDFWE